MLHGCSQKNRHCFHHARNKEWSYLLVCHIYVSVGPNRFENGLGRCRRNDFSNSSSQQGGLSTTIVVHPTKYFATIRARIVAACGWSNDTIHMWCTEASAVVGDGVKGAPLDAGCTIEHGHPLYG